MADPFPIDILESLSYLGIFMWFLLFPLLMTPIPDEIFIISIGYMASIGLINPFIAGLLAVLAYAISDNVVFHLSSVGSSFVKKFKDRLNAKIFVKFERSMKHNLFRTMLTIAFIPKIKTFGPVLAGILKVRWYIFLFYDSLALLLYASFYIAIGFIFHKSILFLFEELTKLETVLFYLMLLFLAWIVLSALIRKIQAIK
jgi:membrane-associated protein